MRNAFQPAPGKKVVLVSHGVAAHLFLFHAGLVARVHAFSETPSRETSFQLRTVQRNIRQACEGRSRFRGTGIAFPQSREGSRFHKASIFFLQQIPANVGVRKAEIVFLRCEAYGFF